MISEAPISVLQPQLQALYRRRADGCPEIWNFCYPIKYKRVKRGEPEYYIPVCWDGASRLVFVASQPSSTGEFPSSVDALYWNAGVRQGLARSYDKSPTGGNVRIFYKGPFVTDMVPQRATVAGALDLKTWAGTPWVSEFKEEINVVKPLLVVAMGAQVCDALKALPDLDVPIEQVLHFGYLRRQATQKAAIERLEVQLSRVKRVYGRLRDTHTHQGRY